MRFVRVGMSSFLVALLISVAIGCKEDPMMRARAAHATERADEAEQALKEVLAAAPKDFEARRLMADVHRFRGEFDKTEEALNALWKEKGFDQEGKALSDEERAYRDLLENQFNELYAKWSESIDASKDAEKFEKVVRAGLVWAPKSPTLNRVLVDHLLARAEALEKEGKKLEAAAAFEQVLGLRAMPAQRKDAQAKADALRKAAFADGAKAHFDANKAEIESAGQWAADTSTITFTVEADVDKRLKQNKDADLDKARQEATGPIRAAIAQWVARMTGVAPELAAKAAVKMTSGGEKLNKGKYSVQVSIGLDDAIDAAYAAQLKDAAAKAKAAEPAEPGEPAEPAAPTEPAAPGTNAGTAAQETN